MTATTLKSHSLKDLAHLAKKRGINGWSSMRKDQLIRALVSNAKAKSAPAVRSKKAPIAKKASRASVAVAVQRAASGKKGSARPIANRESAASKNVVSKNVVSKSIPAAKPASRVTATVNGRSAVSVKPAVNGKAAFNGKPAIHNKLNGQRPVNKPVGATDPTLPRNPRLLKRLQQAKQRINEFNDLSTEALGSAATARDRLVAIVRGPYWLHACWELTAPSISRAKAAMGHDWHSAKPTLRLLGVAASGTATPSEQVLRDIEIHGGVNNWYIDVKDPPHTYRLEVGYLAASKRFYSLARSNVVTTPSAGSGDAVDSHWTEVALDCDKIYAMSGGFAVDTASTELQELFEERMRRPMGSSAINRYGVGVAGLLGREGDFEFAIDAEVLIYGVTHPDAQLVLQGEPVRLRPDGSFTVRCAMPNRRQVIPMVASSRDGAQQRTIVLAVERNTKIMEPQSRESTE